MKKEEYIEGDILDWLKMHWVECYKNDIKGYYNEKKWYYQKNKSNYIRRWISDITAIIEGRYIAIEVKKPSEMKFFDKSLQELKKNLEEAYTRNISESTIKKYIHAVEQRGFLDDIIASGGIWFFTQSIKQTQERLEENWYIIS